MRDGRNTLIFGIRRFPLGPQYKRNCLGYVVLSSSFSEKELSFLRPKSFFSVSCQFLRIFFFCFKLHACFDFVLKAVPNLLTGFSKVTKNTEMKLNFVTHSYLSVEIKDRVYTSKGMGDF